MPVRNGRQFIDGLKSRKREVWLRGERIDDVTTHPAFAGPLGHIAHLYDMQHDPRYRDVLTFPSPETGAPVATAFMPAHTLADLRKRHQAFRIWAEATLGLMGRSPDFLNCVLLCFAESTHVFAPAGERFVDNVVNYYRYARDNDVFLTHALIPPQTDRSKSASEQADPFINLGMVRESAEGIVVRGARMLATLGPIADELIVYNMPILKPDEGRYGLVFAIPLDTPGLRQICRAPYDEGNRARFDHPLAGQFEESDTLVIFDDVLIPWDRVFNYDNVEVANRLFPESNLRFHTSHQTAVRGLVKLQFALGVMMAVAEAVKTSQFLHVQNWIGECINYVELTRSCIRHAEYEHVPTRVGTIMPAYRPLQTLRTMLPVMYPRVIELLQTICAGGLMMMPTAADFSSAIGADVAKYYQGAEGMSAEERVRLYKLAWDLCGDSFGSRQVQYERYYAGDFYRNTAANYLNYDKSECDSLVRRAIDLAGSP